MPTVIDTTIGVGNQTLSWVRSRVSKRLGQEEGFYSGTVTSGSASSLVDSDLPWEGEPNHWYKAEILATSGQNDGLVRTVSASDDHAITFRAFPYAFAIGDTYELRKGHTVADIDGAVEEAILDTNNRVWVATTGTATWAVGTETYTLPADWLLVTAVEYTDADGINHPIRFNHYRCPGDGTVVLDPTALGFFTADTPTVTFRGLRYPLVPTAPSDYIEPPENFVIYSAVAAIRGEGYSAPASDADNDAGAFSTFMQYAQSRGRRTPVPPNTKRAR